MKIKEGQILVLTEGTYSMYQLTGQCLRALRDFDSRTEMQRFNDGNGDCDDFVKWAATECLVETLPEEAVVEWWIGQFGRIEIPR